MTGTDGSADEVTESVTDDCSRVVKRRLLRCCERQAEVFDVWPIVVQDGDVLPCVFTTVRI
jgi:hypothetical protein